MGFVSKFKSVSRPICDKCC